MPITSASQVKNIATLRELMEYRASRRYKTGSLLFVEKAADGAPLLLLAEGAKVEDALVRIAKTGSTGTKTAGRLVRKGTQPVLEIEDMIVASKLKLAAKTLLRQSVDVCELPPEVPRDGDAPSGRLPSDVEQALEVEAWQREIGELDERLLDLEPTAAVKEARKRLAEVAARAIDPKLAPKDRPAVGAAIEGCAGAVDRLEALEARRGLLGGRVRAALGEIPALPAYTDVEALKKDLDEMASKVGNVDVSADDLAQSESYLHALRAGFSAIRTTTRELGELRDRFGKAATGIAALDDAMKPDLEALCQRYLDGVTAPLARPSEFGMEQLEPLVSRSKRGADKLEKDLEGAKERHAARVGKVQPDYEGMEAQRVLAAARNDRLADLDAITERLAALPDTPDVLGERAALPGIKVRIASAAIGDLVGTLRTELDTLATRLGPIEAHCAALLEYRDLVARTARALPLVEPLVKPKDFAAYMERMAPHVDRAQLADVDDGALGTARGELDTFREEIGPMTAAYEELGTIEFAVRQILGRQDFESENPKVQADTRNLQGKLATFRTVKAPTLKKLEAHVASCRDALASVRDRLKPEPEAPEEEGGGEEVVDAPVLAKRLAGQLKWLEGALDKVRTVEGAGEEIQRVREAKRTVAQQKDSLDELRRVQDTLAEVAERLIALQALAREAEGGDGTVVNAVRYHTVTQAEILKTTEGSELLALLQAGTLNDRHRKPETIRRPLHQHLDGGSKGMAFTYVLEGDGSITPWVYDFAANRNGNKYQWRKGGQSSGPPGIPAGVR